MSEPKFPHVEVELSGQDGNAMLIISRTTRAMERAGIDQKDIEAFVDEAMSGNYDNVLQTVMRTVSTT